MPAKVGAWSTIISKVLRSSVSFSFYKIERLLLIFPSAEDSNLDVVGERQRSFSAVAIGLHLASLHLERHLVFAVGSFLGSG